jgi:predicted RecA/RadA family phage recombinase
MKNFVQVGENMNVLAPYAVTAGQGVLVGALFGVASAPAALNEAVVLVTEHCFDLTKVGAQAWTQWQKVYWDNAARNCTNVVGANTLIGVAMLATGAGAGETIGRVRLNGTF